MKVIGIVPCEEPPLFNIGDNCCHVTELRLRGLLPAGYAKITLRYIYLTLPVSDTFGCATAETTLTTYMTI